MDHDASTNDLWTMDRILLQPGIAVELLNRRATREAELLRTISDLIDQVRAANVKMPARRQAMTVEDYAVAISAGLAASFRDVAGKPGEINQVDSATRWSFDRAEAMVAEARRRGHDRHP